MGSQGRESSRELSLLTDKQLPAVNGRTVVAACIGVVPHSQEALCVEKRSPMKTT